MGKKTKKIVVLGAGFAGIRCIQDLSKNLSSEIESGEVELFLIDKNNFHLFRADLYEVATAFNKEISDECLLQLKDTIATPIDYLIDRKKVNFVHDYVVGIDSKEKFIELKSGYKFQESKISEGVQFSKKIRYDYLVVALGSVTNDFGIPGMEKYSFPMKILKDGLRINCCLDSYIREFWRESLEKNNDQSKKDFEIVVAGGGATGVETAGEMVGSLNALAKKYNYPREKIHVTLVEGGNKLAAFDPEGTKLVLDRLEKLGIKVILGKLITEAKKDSLILKDNLVQNSKGPSSHSSKKNKSSENNLDNKIEVISSNLTIWTGGVKVNPIVEEFLGEKDFRGAIPVNQNLQAQNHEDVFAAGDNAYVAENPVPMLADVALQQGKVIAQNLTKLIKNSLDSKSSEISKYLEKFSWKAPVYLLPIGGKWAMGQLKGKYRSGFWVWVYRRFVFLKYAMSILPFGKALRKWAHGTKIFWGNDG